MGGKWPINVSVMIWTEGTLLNAVSACWSVQSMLQGKGPCSLCRLITSSCAARGRAVVHTHAQVSVLSVSLSFGLTNMFMYRSTSVIKHVSEPSLTTWAQHILLIITLPVAWFFRQHISFLEIP